MLSQILSDKTEDVGKKYLLLGSIHNFQWIAATLSFETKKAESFLTLPE